MTTVDLFGTATTMLFDPFGRLMWLSFEQAVVIFRLTDDAFRIRIMRARRRGLIGREAVRVKLSVGRNGRRHEVSFVSIDTMVALTFFGTSPRFAKVVQLGGLVAIALSDGVELEERYVLSDS